MLNKKSIYIFILFLYSSLLIGFFFNEDTNGGARADFSSITGNVEFFLDDFFESFFNYEKLNERHSPVLIIIIAYLKKAGLTYDVIRFANLHLNLLVIFFFYNCLRIKFPKIEKKYLILISSALFISTTIRSLSIWPDSRIVGLLFFTISLQYYLKFNVNKSFKNAILNTIYLVIAFYFSPNFSFFGLYFFFHYFLLYKNSIKLLYIALLNCTLTFPFFYYVFILNINFLLTPGLTPGSSIDGSTILLKEMNIFNKIILVLNIFLYYFIPIIFYHKKNLQKKFNFFHLVAVSFLYLVSIYFFNYSLDYTGGGIFFHVSQKLLGNNILLYFITAFAFYFLLIKNFSANNLFLLLILVLSNPQLTIYHKYYDPLIFILIFTLCDFKIKSDFFTFRNIFNIYVIYLIFFSLKIYQIYF